MAKVDKKIFACADRKKGKPSGMRITGGRARGIPLGTGRARQIRPATDRTREAVFASLGERIAGLRLLDLFAGSGSYGLEALSRGAGGAVFVEKQPAAVRALRQNIAAVRKSLGDPGDLVVDVVQRDARRYQSSEAFGLIFMDPPYELCRAELTGLLGHARTLLAPGGLLVFELPGDLVLPESGWQCLRRIGKTGRDDPGTAILQPVE
jgi:16S rRNA (guanine966-N2)-methyltransferase